MIYTDFYDPSKDTVVRYPVGGSGGGGSSGVSSFNGRNGSVLPMAGDYTAQQIEYDSFTTVKEKIDEELDGINLLHPTNSSITTYGSTITYNTDGTVSKSGTVSGGNAQYGFAVPTNAAYAFPAELEVGKEYILSGCPTGGADGTYEIYIQFRNADNTAWGATYHDYGEGVRFTATGTRFGVYVRIFNGNTDTLVFEPMITEAKYAGVPFRPFNQQSLQHIQHQLDSVCENGAVNHLDNKTTDMTISGITFTVDDNKIIYANGTSANSGATPQIAMPVSLPKGRWVYSGCPDGGSDQKWDMILWDETTSSRLVGGALFNSNDRLEFEITDANVNHSINAYVRVYKGGVVCNNIAFKPMIAPASYTGSYVPYAMTNRELTEVKSYTGSLSGTNVTSRYVRAYQCGKIVQVHIGITIPNAQSAGANMDMTVSGIPLPIEVVNGVTMLGSNVHVYYLESTGSCRFRCMTATTASISPDMTFTYITN